VHINRAVAVNSETENSQAKKAFLVVASLVRIHLISLLDVNDLLCGTKISFNNKPILPSLQLNFNI
jgi:hypothetical protein